MLLAQENTSVALCYAWWHSWREQLRVPLAETWLKQSKGAQCVLALNRAAWLKLISKLL